MLLARYFLYVGGVLFRLRRRSPTSRQRRACGRRLRSSCRLSQRNRKRSCNENARLQDRGLPRRWFRSRNNRDLAFFPTTVRTTAGGKLRPPHQLCIPGRSRPLYAALSTTVQVGGRQSPTRCATTVSLVGIFPMLP